MTSENYDSDDDLYVDEWLLMVMQSSICNHLSRMKNLHEVNGPYMEVPNHCVPGRNFWRTGTAGTLAIGLIFSLFLGILDIGYFLQF